MYLLNVGWVTAFNLNWSSNLKCFSSWLVDFCRRSDLASRALSTEPGRFFLSVLTKDDWPSVSSGAVKGLI